MRTRLGIVVVVLVTVTLTSTLYAGSFGSLSSGRKAEAAPPPPPATPLHATENNALGADKTKPMCWTPSEDSLKHFNAFMKTGDGVAMMRDMAYVVDSEVSMSNKMTPDDRSKLAALLRMCASLGGRDAEFDKLVLTSICNPAGWTPGDQIITPPYTILTTRFALDVKGYNPTPAIEKSYTGWIQSVVAKYGLKP